MSKQEILEEFTEWINQSKDEDIKGYFFVLNTKPSLRTLHGGEIDKRKVELGKKSAFDA